MAEYAVVRTKDNPLTADSIVRRWSEVPKALTLPDGKRLLSPVGVPEHLGFEYAGYRFVEVERVGFERPGAYYDKGGLSLALTAKKLTATQVWTAWTQQQIDDYEAARKAQQIADFGRSPMSGVLFAMAQQINPGLTKAQFAAFVEQHWGPLI